MFHQLKKTLFVGLAITSSLFALTKEEMRQDLESFFDAYERQYAFFELKNKDHGVDWSQVYQKSKQKLEAAQDEIDFYQILAEAQVALGDGHCYNNAIDLAYSKKGLYYLPARFVVGEGNRVFIAAVKPGTDLAEQVEIGDRLIGIDGKSIRSMARQAKKWVSASSPGQFWANFVGSMHIRSPYLGKPNSSKAILSLEDLEGNRKEVEVSWGVAKPEPKPASPMSSFAEDLDMSSGTVGDVSGALPLELKIFEENQIGYMKLSSFMKIEDPKPQFEKALELLEGTQGLILDLRGNGGGVAKWGYLLANYFVDNESPKINDGWIDVIYSKAYFQRMFNEQFTPQVLNELFSSPEGAVALFKQLGVEITEEEIAKHFRDGEFYNMTRPSKLNHAVNDKPAYDKPLVVLMDGGCYSTTDIFMTALNDYNRAVFVGTPNGAGSGSPIPYVLKNSGFTAHISHGKFFTTGDVMIEGRPIQPDYLVSQTQEDVAVGRDTILQAGYQVLMEKIMPGSSFAGFDPEEPALISSTIEEKEFEFGKPQTPDYIRNSLWEAQQKIDLK